MNHQLLQRHTVVSNFPGEVAILREGLVRICDGNHCAAMLLDYFYEKTWIFIECQDDVRCEGGCREIRHSIHTNSNKLKLMMSDLFTHSDIDEAIQFLEKKGYIGEAETTPSDGNYASPYTASFEIWLDTNIDAVDNALRILQGEEPKPQIILEPEPEPEPITTSIRPPKRNNSKEAKRVAFHLSRAKTFALPASLTVEQWLVTLEHFGWKCAYCETGEYEVFEHFLPLFHGGGTTWNNCVPACYSCNRQKSDLHPSTFKDRMGDAIEHVLAYLKTCESESKP